MVETIYCVHCGAVAKHPVFKTIGGQSLSFCCGGCAEVYEMLHEEGLDSGQGVSGITNQLMPVGANLINTQPNQSAQSETVIYHIMGMTCANCVATVERKLRSVSGVLEVRVILETELATVKMIPDKVSLADMQRAVEKAGYGITPEGGA